MIRRLVTASAAFVLACAGGYLASKAWFETP